MDRFIDLTSHISALGWRVESMGQLIDSRWHVSLQRIDDDGTWTVPVQFAPHPNRALELAILAIPQAYHRSYALEAQASASLDLVALGLCAPSPPPPTFALAKRFAK